MWLNGWPQNPAQPLWSMLPIILLEIFAKLSIIIIDDDNAITCSNCINCLSWRSVSLRSGSNMNLYADELPLTPVMDLCYAWQLYSAGPSLRDKYASSRTIYITMD
jgi:hypothetical protein